MSTATVDAIEAILSAPSGAALFGSAPDAHRRYKGMLREVHPDMVPAEDQKRAAEAFGRLNDLWAAFSGSGAHPGAGGSSGGAGGRTVIKTRKHEYEVGRELAGDEVFAVYEATYDAGHQSATLLIANDAADADLVAAYQRAIKADFDPAFRAFYPELLEAFRYTEGAENFPALAIKRDPALRLFTLAEIGAAYKARGGLHGRDVAWLWRRMLVALGNAHDADLIHGAPVAEAWLVEPDQHGVILAGWQYSPEAGQPLAAVPSAHRDLYPASVTVDRVAPDRQLDVALAAKTLLALAHPDQTPKAIVNHLRGCTLGKLPHEAQLLAEFDEVLDRVYGGKHFHVFSMPPA